MSWSFQIARAFGIPIRVHLTFLLIVAWAAFSWGGRHGFHGALFGVISTLALFVSVTLHELGHVWAAGARPPGRLGRSVLAAVDDSGPAEQIVAVGSYRVDPASQVAELAFTVRDDWQGEGVGAYLFERLLAIGRDRGVVDFVAFVQQDNFPMIELIHRHAPGPVESRLDEGVLELRFSARRTTTDKHVGESA